VFQYDSALHTLLPVGQRWLKFLQRSHLENNQCKQCGGSAEVNADTGNPKGELKPLPETGREGGCAHPSVPPWLRLPAFPVVLCRWDALVQRVVLTRSNPLLPSAFPSAQYHTEDMTSRLAYLYPAEDLKTGYNTCAVVGNGGLLRADSYGRDIDAHDVVIRFNDGPTGNWTPYVGSRTSVRVINNYWTRRYQWTRPKGAYEENLMLFSFKTLRYLARIRLRFQSPHENVVFMAPGCEPPRADSSLTPACPWHPSGCRSG